MALLRKHEQGCRNNIRRDPRSIPSRKDTRVDVTRCGVRLRPRELGSLAIKGKPTKWHTSKL